MFGYVVKLFKHLLFYFLLFNYRHLNFQVKLVLLYNPYLLFDFLNL